MCIIQSSGFSKLETPEVEATNVRLYACETTRIKSSSEQIINAIMGNDLVSCVGLNEPAENPNIHLLVGRTLIKASKTVPVRVANVAPVGTTIYLLATCSPVMKINSCEVMEEKCKSTGKPASINVDLKHLAKIKAERAREFLR